VPSPARSTGFTLLELLVVIFIVGVIAAMATLSIGTVTRDQGVEKEVERVGDLLALAREEAVLQNREFGLTFYRREYEFSVFDVATASWTPLAAAAAGPLAPRSFPPETEVELAVEDRRVALAERRPERRPQPKTDDDKRQTDKDDDAPEPQVLILSSGDVTPFNLRLSPELGEGGAELHVAESGTTRVVFDERPL
jgi:general secretion pathway protein H